MCVLLGRENILKRRSKEEEIELESQANFLWGMVHSRYAHTNEGLNEIVDKYLDKKFGLCPRIGCGECPVMPCATTDIPGTDSLKGYCMRCRDLYHITEPNLHIIDGAYFGTSPAHLLEIVYPSLDPGLGHGLGPRYLRMLDMVNMCGDDDENSCEVMSNDKTASMGGSYTSEDSSADSGTSIMASSSSSSSFNKGDRTRGICTLRPPFTYLTDISAALLHVAPKDNSCVAIYSIPCYSVFSPKMYSFKIGYRCPYIKHKRWLRWREPIDEKLLYPSAFEKSTDEQKSLDDSAKRA